MHVTANNTSQAAAPSLRRTWLVLALPPVLFLAVVIIGSIGIGIAARGDAALITERVQNALPVMLLVVQLLLAGLLAWALRGDRLSLVDVGWMRQTTGIQVLVGALAGVALGLLYVYVLSPLVTRIQLQVGDYIPPGEILPTLRLALVPFFIANVLLAPFVEETLYRGYALTRLSPRFGTPLAVLLSCVFFGLLHLTGGFWYMLLTGFLAGGLFAGLLLWQRGLWAPFSAHMALNLVEFLFVWLAL